MKSDPANPRDNLVCMAETAACGLSSVSSESGETDLFYLDIPLEDASEAQRDRCRLDVYYPAGGGRAAVIVWFHGGGFTEGVRGVPEGLRGRGYTVVAAGYRLAPAVRSPAYLEDAAAAVAWVFRNIACYGGDPTRIFIAGSSAGGYLAAMLGLDKSLLGAHGIDADRLAGCVAMTGQMTTHFHIRTELGHRGPRPVIDRFAPLWHIRQDASPLLLLTGDRELDLPGRVEENLLLARMMQVVGHADTVMHEIRGQSHGMTSAGIPIMLKWLAARGGCQCH